MSDSSTISTNEPVVLPRPLPEFALPSDGGSPAAVDSYFAPDRWDAEVAHHAPSDDRDPVELGLGKIESTSEAVLVLSDFHMADGSTGGDDFLDSHLHRDEELDIETGFFPPGRSQAELFAAVVTFALDRVRQAGGHSRLDVVLNGDVINFLDLQGRGGTLVCRKHLQFFPTLDAVGSQGSVIWPRCNQDYVVPEGPWRRGEFYANPGAPVARGTRGQIRPRELASGTWQQGVAPGPWAGGRPVRRRRTGERRRVRRPCWLEHPTSK
jgi:hypothetical protein